MNLVDGCIPSDTATGKPAQIDEERRLLYVAMTRARGHLHLIQPLRFFRIQQHRHGDGHTMAPRSRFITDEMLSLFDRRSAASTVAVDAGVPAEGVAVNIGARMRSMWT